MENHVYLNKLINCNQWHRHFRININHSFASNKKYGLKTALYLIVTVALPLPRRTPADRLIGYPDNFPKQHRTHFLHGLHWHRP